MTDYNALLRAELGTWTCAVCGCVNTAGLGYWAFHADEDETPVCRGKCWRKYSAMKAELLALGYWESFYPGLTDE